MKVNTSLLKITVWSFLLITISFFFISTSKANAFSEGWESATVGTYTPDNMVSPFIQGDEGSWILGDTVSGFPDCGPTPHTAEIFSSGGNKSLRLTSNDSNSFCGDNIWVGLGENQELQMNTGFSVPLTADTLISFEEKGSLINPQSEPYICLPSTMCSDMVALLLEDNLGNILAYVLQRPPDAMPNENYSWYRDIFLDPNEGVYSRNLFADFQTIPDFNPTGVSIRKVVFEISNHGNATIDNICIGTSGCSSFSTEWAQETSMLEARDQFTGGVIAGKIYVFGGNGNPDGINLKSIEMFDPATHLWTYKSSNENNNGQGVEELTGAVLNDKLYVFGAEGGGTPYGVFNFVQEYDPATDTWTSKAPKPTVVSGATAAVYDGEIFLFGGGYSNTETTSRINYDVVEAYNPTSNTWRIVTNMPYNLGHMAVSIIGTKAYLIGGYDRNSGNLQQNVIAYDFVSNQWITEGLGELSAPRLFFYASSAPIVDGKIYLIGGWTNVGWNFTDESNLSITNEVQIYAPSTQSFSLGPSLPQATDDFLTLSTNNYIYVLGGETDWENSISTNAVWRLDLAPKPNITPIINLLLSEDIYFDIGGVWDVYIPDFDDYKLDTFYLEQSGNQITGLNIFSSSVTGTINENNVQLLLPDQYIQFLNCFSFNGIIDNQTVSGILNCGGEFDGSEMFIEKSELYFNNFIPGQAFNSTTPEFSWTAKESAEKYFIHVMLDNDTRTCGATENCPGVWELGGITDTSIIFNSDNSAYLDLVPGNNYRVRVYAQLNSQPEWPIREDTTTYIDLTMDVTFSIAAP